MEGRRDDAVVRGDVLHTLGGDGEGTEPLQRGSTAACETAPESAEEDGASHDSHGTTAAVPAAGVDLDALYNMARALERYFGVEHASSGSEAAEGSSVSDVHIRDLAELPAIKV